MGLMAEGAPWVAMELLEPIPAALPWPRVARFAMQLLEALAYAHARGTLHRDIKPANLGWRRADDRAVLLDFGLASLADDRTFASTLGTPHYAAPEQILGDEWAQGPWTDLYALKHDLDLAERPPHVHGRRARRAARAPPRLRAS